MRPPSPRLPRPNRSWSRLLRIVWAVAVAQILLIVMDPGGLSERLGPVLLAVSLASLLLLAAAARGITYQPQPVPAAEAGRNDVTADAVVTATALGGPCDGASWQLRPDQLPAPQQVWWPANGSSHCYRLDSRPLTRAPTSSATLSYSHHHTTSTTDTPPS